VWDGLIRLDDQLIEDWGQEMATKIDRFVFQRWIKRNWYNQGLKRIFDIIVSTIVLVLISPILGFIALAVQRESPGPAFFRGNRLGRGGKTFKILKFRTMYETPESYAGPRVTAQDDPRVTPFGHWLRDTKINELPQFWNVLKGEMSLVGPRPEDPSIAKTWPRKVWDEVLSVRPGITSPASVQYHNEEALLSYGGVLSKYIHELGPDKMRLDQLYVRYRSFWLDLDTLLWTVLIFVPRIGTKTLPEDLLFVGPFTRLIRRYLNWFTIDLLITFAAISLTGLIWRAFEPLNVGWFRAAVIAFGFAFLFSLTKAFMGVNHIAWSKATFADAYELLPPWLIAFTIAFLFNWQMALFPGALVVVASVIALGGFVLVRYRSRLITALLVSILRHRSGAHGGRERVLIVGSGRTAEHIAWLFDHPTYTRKFQVVGFVDDDLMNKGMRIYGAKVVGDCHDLPELVIKHEVGLILLADHRLTNRRCRSIIEACDNLPAKIMSVPDLFGSLNSLTGAVHTGLSKDDDGRDKSEFRCQRCLARYGASEKEDEMEESYEA
jgi:lipopolysaccharide/colanic/teichoic acid biosynthesis glycosyltransferase